jgi:ABC-type lipoprotein export system ATPase subunit
LQTIRKESGTTIIVVTHDQHVAAHTDRIITLIDGQIAHEVTPDRTAATVADMLK